MGALLSLLRVESTALPVSLPIPLPVPTPLSGTLYRLVVPPWILSEDVESDAGIQIARSALPFAIAPRGCQHAALDG
jgi:hypothetical protein